MMQMVMLQNRHGGVFGKQGYGFMGVYMQYFEASVKEDLLPSEFGVQPKSDYHPQVSA